MAPSSAWTPSCPAAASPLPVPLYSCRTRSSAASGTSCEYHSTYSLLHLICVFFSPLAILSSHWSTAFDPNAKAHQRCRSEKYVNGTDRYVVPDGLVSWEASLVQHESLLIALCLTSL